MPDLEQPSNNHSAMRINQLLAVFLKIPVLWAIVVAIAVALSTIEITRTAEDQITFIFKLTTITPILLSILWLPSLIKLLALSGGKVKFGGSEASTGGLGPLLPKLVAGLYKIETELPPEDKQEIRRLREQAESELASRTIGYRNARSRIEGLAREYERLRDQMESGGERTHLMSVVVAEIRSITPQAEYSSEEMMSCFAEASAGNRIAVLSMLQATSDTSCFSAVLSGISESSSAFEQYNALRAAETMIPLLFKDQRNRLRNAINEQRGEGEGRHIKPKTDRWSLSDRILRAIEE